MANKITLFVGTNKGLFTYESKDRKTWELRDPFLAGWEVSSILPGLESIMVGTSHFVYGATIRVSRDGGETFTQSEGSPHYTNSKYKVNRIWQLAKHPTKGTLYAGVDEAGLFRSDDDGKSWQEVSGLTQHETRSLWAPGAGGLCLHTILFDPTNDQRMWVAMSAVGVFRSDDDGKSWQVKTKGIDAIVTDQKTSEVGRCIHKMVLHPNKANELFIQYHGGVYKTDNAADDWTSIETGLPSNFGFPMVITHTEKLHVIPLESDLFRTSAEGKLRVYTFNKTTQSWQDDSDGLSSDGHYSGVLRDAMTVDTQAEPGVYFGTTGGEVFARVGEDSWQRLPGTLPRIMTLRVLES
ncbi:MAG: WD40/YVTN/BNR-like repeat-containing protein [Trueperaceae bacterium]